MATNIGASGHIMNDIIDAVDHALTYTAPNITVNIDPGISVGSSATHHDGVVSSQSGSVLINDGNIFGARYGVNFNSLNARITNNDNGTIVGFFTGIYVNPASDGAIINNHGTVIAQNNYGVIASDAANAVLNNDGTIYGQDYGVLWANGSINGTINNSGLIRSSNGTNAALDNGIRVLTAAGDITDINNLSHGTIKGTDAAIFSVAFGRIHLDNSGKIAGNIDLDATGGNVNDRVINKGDINGHVFLGLGNDVFRNGGAGESGQVYGEEGNDKLFGGNDRDVLRGGSDVDLIRGGRNKDILFGGDDRDLFDFNSIKESLTGSKRDKIMDFHHGNNVTGDDIDLSSIDAKKGVSGNQAFKFIGTHNFHDMKGELRYIDKGASCIVQGDVDGDGHADLEIFVKVGSLVKGDFLL